MLNGRQQQPETKVLTVRFASIAENSEIWLTRVTVAGMAGGFLAYWYGQTAWALAGYAIVYLAGGLPAAMRALSALWNEHVLDIDLLMVVAAVAAAAVGAPLEGAVLLTLFSMSTTLEHRAMGRARKAVEALMSLRPDTAMLRQGGNVIEVPTSSLKPDDVVLLRPGARVPVDGVIIQGEGSLDEATITGESLPVHKGEGAQVFEATVNLNALLEMKVTRSTAESTVARMIKLVTEAQAARAPSERFSEWFGQRYTIGVLLGSILAFGVFLALGSDLQDALYHSATLLVAASPCAIVISVPAAILSALSAAARGGVLFKGGAALETLGAVRAFAFDKTGTLTTGRAEVTDVIAIGMSEDDFIARLSGLEHHSEHPVADAIRRDVERRGVAPLMVGDVTAFTSEGISGTDGGHRFWAGNHRMAARMGANLDLPELAEAISRSQTMIFMGQEELVLGAVSVADQARASSAAGVRALRESGIKDIIMMTGDRRAVADKIGAELGFMPTEIHADLLAADKVALVSGLAGRGKVAFVGDGVNDAAALARADVGIAMGAAGSEVALQAADVALLSEDMTRLAEAHRLARRTGRIIRQNLIFAMGAMVTLVTGALFFNLPLPLAVIGHEGGTVLVVLNGLRLLADPIRADRA
jgi:Zn2+/Cd2+-exporting ATPase